MALARFSELVRTWLLRRQLRRLAKRSSVNIKYRDPVVVFRYFSHLSAFVANAKRFPTWAYSGFEETRSWRDTYGSTAVITLVEAMVGYQV